MICHGPADIGWVIPRERLTTGLAGLVDVVNRARVMPSPGPNCVTSLSHPSYVMVFRYPGGVRAITGQPDLCDSLDVGDEFRSDASVVWRRYLRLLAAQRAHEWPAGVTERARCPRNLLTAPVSPSPQLGSVRLGRLCRFGPRGHLVGPGIPVPQRLLDAVRYDVRHLTLPPASSNGCLQRPVRRILYLAATDVWEGRILFQIDCGGVFQISPGRNPVPASGLQPRAVHLLETLVTQAVTLKP
jgi:hypothetical protein